MLSRDEVLAVTLTIAVALLVVTFAVLLGVSTEPRAARQDGAPDAACLEWTDSCVVCSRTSQGLACSTPGIACTRSAPRCLWR
ncbi:hypothetical protein VB618_05180 [Microvirga sp. CF3062]|uniref:hypothetical protein n=1 Tax=Microvirga sp. CF3062 TaxID=3110182 RepID=UPI002E7975EE|nr:hypothetical protein [Microvirga sp. CF3062]MEE1655582.1 hypothetical protein [Microvirga sp. CF3062]